MDANQTPAPSGRTGEPGRDPDPRNESAPDRDERTEAREGQQSKSEHVNDTADPDTLRTEIPEAMRVARRWLVWRLEPNADPSK